MTCIPFIPEESFGTAADFGKAVHERAGLVPVYPSTPFSASLGAKTAADLLRIPCHVVNSDPILNAANPWSVTIEHGPDGWFIAPPEHTHVPNHAHEGDAPDNG